MGSSALALLEPRTLLQVTWGLSGMATISGTAERWATVVPRTSQPTTITFLEFTLLWSAAAIATVEVVAAITAPANARRALRTPVARHVLTAVTAALTHASTASTVVVVLPALPSVLPLCLFTVTALAL